MNRYINPSAGLHIPNQATYYTINLQYWDKEVINFLTNLRKRHSWFLQLLAVNVDTSALAFGTEGGIYLLWDSYYFASLPCFIFLSSNLTPRSSLRFGCIQLIFINFHLTQQYPMDEAGNMKYMKCLQIKQSFISNDRPM